MQFRKTASQGLNHFKAGERTVFAAPKHIAALAEVKEAAVVAQKMPVNQNKTPVFGAIFESDMFGDSACNSFDVGGINVSRDFFLNQRSGVQQCKIFVDINWQRTLKHVRNRVDFLLRDPKRHGIQRKDDFRLLQLEYQTSVTKIVIHNQKVG